MERELKLEVLEDDIDRLIDLPLLAACRVEPPHEDTLVSTYFDTADLALHRHRISLRVRQAGEHYVLTLKTYGKRSGGLYEREEFEAAIPGPAPDLVALQEKVPQDTAAGALIRQSDLAERLKPLFVTEVRRKVALLRLPQGDEIELALDRGVIRAGEATAPIRELEMEIQTGEPAHLAAFALQLLDEVPLRISRASKGDRGYALVSDASIEVLRAGALSLDDDASVEAAFLCIVQDCLAQVAGNEGGVVNSTNPESVHQMRVGLRRLRSALDIFQSLISCPSALQDEIKWIAGALGPSRDWEVLTHTTLREAFNGAPADVGIDEVMSAANNIANGARHAPPRRWTPSATRGSCWHSTTGWAPRHGGMNLTKWGMQAWLGQSANSHLRPCTCATKSC
ncbi:Protein of the adenylate cyclase family (fragment) [Cupriavidus taiwanensis]|uniref:Protein of the adenylate cyclase family n=1 Tax=Cupriavidus taiwanensis TaxID=164546 RepID=A0A7Z7NR57_9BURK